MARPTYHVSESNLRNDSFSNFFAMCEKVWYRERPARIIFNLVFNLTILIFAYPRCNKKCDGLREKEVNPLSVEVWKNPCDGVFFLLKCGVSIERTLHRIGFLLQNRSLALKGLKQNAPREFSLKTIALLKGPEMSQSLNRWCE